VSRQRSPLNGGEIISL